jgi:hypothetical protein
MTKPRDADERRSLQGVLTPTILDGELMRPRPVFLVLAVMSCTQAPPPPAPVPPPPRPAPIEVDAGAPTLDAGPPTTPPELNGESVAGVPDDAPLDPDDLREAAVQKLLIRDPDQAIRVLERAPGPSTFLIAVLANLATRRGVEGPPVRDRESPLPPVPASGTSPNEPGTAFVGVQWAELKAKNGKGKALATIPTGTELTIDAIDGGVATVTVHVATRVDFGSDGAAPINVATKPVSGSLPVAELVTERPNRERLIAQAAAQPDTDEGHDTALVLHHRSFLLGPSEGGRARMLEAAWRARRPSWVAAAALEPVWVTPKSLRAAWGCRGALPKAKWLPLGPKLPPDVCVTGVSVQHSCEGPEPASIAKRKEQLTALGLAAPTPVLEVVVDASRARGLWVATLPIRPLDECEEREEHKLDLFGSTIRRLPLPLGTSAMVVSVPVSGWHGLEHSVVGAQSEAKARDWLRARRSSKWTYDGKGEPAPSLGVGDLEFRSERDVWARSFGRLPQHDCELCGRSEFR